MSRAKPIGQLKTQVSLRHAEWGEIVNALMDHAFGLEREIDEDSEEVGMIRTIAKRLDEKRMQAIQRKLRQVGPR